MEGKLVRLRGFEKTDLEPLMRRLTHQGRR
jgi:hypothetical protein